MASAKQPWLISIVGPTASGKTALALSVAQYFGTEIISFDSRQCYQELNIGVARPSKDELAMVRHHFIASHSIFQPIQAASFAEMASETLAKLFQRFPIVVAVGGTGLYLKSLLHGLDNIPVADEVMRRHLRQQYTQHGMDWLRESLIQADPLFATRGEMQNPHRMLRALEVVLSSGQSILSFRNQTPAARPFQTLNIGIDLPKPYLHERIAQRTAWMMASGLVDEARPLYTFRNLSPLQTVGYKEVFEYVEGTSTLAQTQENIAIHTRQYAKRQLTWFRKQEQVSWFTTAHLSGVVRHIVDHTERA